MSDAKPCAWVARAENGNIRCWTSAADDALRLAKEIGFELSPLYDQAALDAAVMAERERCAQLCEGLATFVHPYGRQQGGLQNSSQYMGAQITEGESQAALNCAKRIRAG